jgi:hypothetical protein
MILNHREEIRWIDLSFLERQEKVFARFADNFDQFFDQLNPSGADSG